MRALTSEGPAAPLICKAMDLIKAASRPSKNMMKVTEDSVTSKTNAGSEANKGGCLSFKTSHTILDDPSE